MKKRLSQAVKSFTFLAMLSLMAASPVKAQTAWGGVCVGGEDGDVATIQGLECLIANIFTVFLTVLGLSGFVMMIVASFRILVSGGNSKGKETGRNTFTFAVVGLIAALSSYIVLNLIADFTGIQEILEFKIPTSDEIY